MKKEIFLDDLPIKEGIGKLKGKQVIDWINSIGYKINFIYDNIEGKIEIISYNSKTHNLYIKYLDKEPFKISTSNLKRCNLGKLLGKVTNEFKVEIGQTFKDDKRDITIIDREYREIEKVKTRNKRKYKILEKEKWYKYKCNKCGWNEGWIIEGSLLRGTGCATCCSNPRTVIEGINSIVDTDPWMIKYFQGGYEEAKLYNKSSHQRIYPICPDCGRVKNKSMKIDNIFYMHSIGCSCSDGLSYPFKLMYLVLEQLNIKFITEYSPEWIKPKRYDFYFELNNNKYIIEMDGGLGHGKDNKLSGQTKEESKGIDDYKDRLANEHAIEVIRIDCNKSELEYIKNNVLHSKLINIFNLSKINWNKCEEFALSNLVKKACELKHNNPDMTTLDIANILNLHRKTITDYFKKGTKLGWCKYDPREENFKAHSKAGKMNGKLVEILINNFSLGVFPSALYLEENAERLFGIKLSHSNISAVCRGKRKSHKGFTFKYVDSFKEVVI